MHTAQISPPTASDSQIQIIEEKERDEEKKPRKASRKWSLSLLRRERSVDTDVTFTGLAMTEEYSVTISTIINGKRILSLTQTLDKISDENMLELSK